jgi:large subunit ribosomal protein L18
MSRQAKTRRDRRSVRHRRARSTVAGVPERPRLAVSRSLKHIYAQVIDDTRGVTLAAASSLEGEVRDQRDGKPKAAVGALVGEVVARRAVERGIKAVVFDRGGCKYHGRVKAVAEAARKGGLKF